jgi:hypothetical protein
MSGLTGFLRSTFRFKKPEMITDNTYPLYLTPHSSPELARDVSRSTSPASTISSDTSCTSSSYDVFGVSLDEAVQQNDKFEDNIKMYDSKLCAPELQKHVPAVVLKCVEFITMNGIKQEGIYRISGSSVNVERLQKRFQDEGPTFEIDPEEVDVDTVASLFKLFLRQLPIDILNISRTPELAYDSNSSFELLHRPPLRPDESGHIKREEELPSLKVPLLDLIGEELRDLRECHFAMLHVLIRHLHNVASNSDESRMSLSNLVVIFSPTLRMNKLLLAELVKRGDLNYEDFSEEPKSDSQPAEEQKSWNPVIRGRAESFDFFNPDFFNNQPVKAAN